MIIDLEAELEREGEEGRRFSGHCPRRSLCQTEIGFAVCQMTVMLKTNSSKVAW